MVEAEPGDLLSLATMLVQSNDRFFAIQRLPVDLTLWDAGTEVDEPAGTGPHQAPRQTGPGDGEPQDGAVVMLPGAGVHIVITPEG